LFRSLIQINLLQAFIILLVSLPLIISLTDKTVAPTSLTSVSTIVGLLVFVIGLSIETLADSQIDKFVKQKKQGQEEAKFLTTGLFRFSRRPNYFGETLVWLGLAIIVLPLPYGYFALLSPLLITLIMTQITGPMLEKIFLAKYGPSYEYYMKNTSYFIPLLPKN
jgi:steroid 5-alpha reductase family enzyme